jgi:hypothetical protein
VLKHHFQNNRLSVYQLHLSVYYIKTIWQGTLNLSVWDLLQQKSAVWSVHINKPVGVCRLRDGRGRMCCGRCAGGHVEDDAECGSFAVFIKAKSLPESDFLSVRQFAGELSDSECQRVGIEL